MSFDARIRKDEGILNYRRFTSWKPFRFSRKDISKTGMRENLRKIAML